MHRLVVPAPSEVDGANAFRIRLDPRGRREVRWIGRRILAFLGYSIEDVDRPGFLNDVIHPDEIALTAVRQQRLLAGYPCHAHFRLRRKDGSWCRCRASLWPVQSPDSGVVVGIEGALEEDAADGSGQVPSVASTAELEAVGLFTEDGTWIYASPSVADILGQNPQALIGTNLFSLVHWESLREAVRMQNRLLAASGATATSWLRICRIGGVWRWIEITTHNLLEDPAFRAILATFNDVTDYVSASRAIEASESFWRALVENSPDAVWVIDAKGRLRFANRVTPGNRLVGLLGRSVYPFVLDAYRDDFRRAVERVAREGGQMEQELQAYRSSSEIAWYRVRLVRLDDAGAEPAVIAVATNVTSERCSRQAVERAEAQWRTMIRHAPDFIATVNREGICTFVNGAVAGYEPSDIQGAPLANHIDPAFKEEFFACLRGAVEEGRTSAYRNSGLGPNGRRAWYLNRIGPIRDRGGITGAVIMSTDVTDEEHVVRELRRLNEQLQQNQSALEKTVEKLRQENGEREQAEAGLRQSEAELRRLWESVDSIQQEERKRMAREVHDELGQALTAIKLELSAIERRLPRQFPEFEARLRRADSMIADTLTLVRRLAHQLHPAILDDLGLVDAVQWRLREFGKTTGLQCSLELNTTDIAVDHDRAAAVYQVFQEAITNIGRHADAGWVRAKLEVSDGSLCMTVCDDGRGISKEALRDLRSFGLLGMRERSQMFGGQLEIAGEPGQGTQVKLEMPLHERWNNGARNERQPR